MRMGATLDTEALSPEAARELCRLVDAAGFFELPSEIIGATQGADRFLYTVTIEQEGRHHRVRTSDAASPATLRPLLGWLTNAARKAQRSRGTP
jgi:hypothetical protein